jgi:pyruvate dehydrogenase E1 component
LRAQEILADKYGVPANVWSVTSYNELRRDALAVERWNRLHPAEGGEAAIHSHRPRRR